METLTVFALYTLATLFIGYTLGRPSRRGAHICPVPDEDPDMESGGLKASDAPGRIEKPFEREKVQKGST